ncbi:helix-turn-helix domain-containing protein [Agrobacterium cavarae]|uniref:helix-turn-helix domain-containing protein n=1 Tax=Agrobacterium cavarae TaxID=2528239 RepID=UPI002896F215|nr:helix-turn-helix domain-containing protein [Agrobacterium cavarae]
MSDLETHPIVYTAKFSDADEASSLLSSSYATVRLEPLTGSSFDFEVSGLKLPDLDIYRSGSTTGLSFKSVEHFDGFTFSSMRCGALEVVSAAAAHIVSDNLDLAIDAKTVDTLFMSRQSAFCGLAISAKAIQKGLEERINDAAPRRLSFKSPWTPLQISSSYIGLCDILYEGFRGGGHLENNPIAVRNMQDALINLIVYGVEHNYSEALAAGSLEAPALIRRAIDYMHAHAHLPISTVDIAQELRVGVRTLQLSFQRWAETTPHHYLRSIRLKLARRDLLDGSGAPVGVVAKRWGFNSPGEFARLYHLAFDEKPAHVFRRELDRK